MHIHTCEAAAVLVGAVCAQALAGGADGLSSVAGARVAVHSEGGPMTCDTNTHTSTHSMHTHQHTHLLSHPPTHLQAGTHTRRRPHTHTHSQAQRGQDRSAGLI